MRVETKAQRIEWYKNNLELAYTRQRESQGTIDRLTKELKEAKALANQHAFNVTTLTGRVSDLKNTLRQALGAIQPAEDTVKTISAALVREPDLWLAS